MTKQPCIFEIVIFTVKDEHLKDMPKIRQEMREAVQTFSGFIEMNNLTPAGDNHSFADLVKWDTLDNALSAAKVFASTTDKRLISVMNAIQDVKFMGHFIL